jgi:hypothetical protein
MSKKFLMNCCFLIPILFSNSRAANAIDRVVLTSIPSELWYETIYLLADKKSWMEYENFTVQVGDRGQSIYHFPNWYHGKYDPEMNYIDLDGNKLKDIIIVLNNYRISGPGKPYKDIHVLNQYSSPSFEEVKVEPIVEAVKRLAKMDKKGDIVTITTNEKQYRIDTSIYNYNKPGEPYLNTDSVGFSIEQGKYLGEGILIASIGVGLVGPIHGGIGSFDIRYGWDWDKKAYIAEAIKFEQYIPEKIENQ